LIAIIDYGMGNVKSIFNAFYLLGENAEIIDDPKKLSQAESIVLPGVGAFEEGIKNLKEMGFIEILEKEVIDHKKPYLGICLGLEFLADMSLEKGTNKGFGWISGTVKKIETGDPSLKVPHMGWNDTEVKSSKGLFKEIENPSFYYLHSYYFDVNESEKDVITSICNYGKTPITASIQRANVYATQFHPEKSQSVGIKLLKNFVDDIRK